VDVVQPKPVIDEEAERWIPGDQRNAFEPAVMHPPKLQPLFHQTREGYVWLAVSATGAESFHAVVPYYDWHHHQWMTKSDQDRRLALGEFASWADSLEELQEVRRDSEFREVTRQNITQKKQLWKYRVIE